MPRLTRVSVLHRTGWLKEAEVYRVRQLLRTLGVNFPLDVRRHLCDATGDIGLP